MIEFRNPGMFITAEQVEALQTLLSKQKKSSLSLSRIVIYIERIFRLLL